MNQVEVRFTAGNNKGGGRWKGRFELELNLILSYLISFFKYNPSEFKVN